jgi:hypothetical protein
MSETAKAVFTFLHVYIYMYVDHAVKIWTFELDCDVSL